MSLSVKYFKSCWARKSATGTTCTACMALPATTPPLVSLELVSLELVSLELEELELEELELEELVEPPLAALA